MKRKYAEIHPSSFSDPLGGFLNSSVAPPSTQKWEEKYRKPPWHTVASTAMDVNGKVGSFFLRIAS
jgi:hypothetical protein